MRPDSKILLRDLHPILIGALLAAVLAWGGRPAALAVEEEAPATVLPATEERATDEQGTAGETEIEAPATETAATATSDGTEPSTAAEETTALEQPERPASLAEIFERASRWVVALRVERTKDVEVARAGGTERLPREMRSYYERPEGWVSGVLVDRDGLVLTTSYNVAGEVKSVEVALPSEKIYPAKVVSRSEADDLALLRIERPEDAPPIPFEEPLWADASDLRAGQIVFAVGRSPAPGRITVTRGILSAVGRNGGRAVQTDAELNYGNVGGPLVNLDGRIVAIAGFVGHDRPQWGLNSGVGFGTTAATLLAVLPRLREGGDLVAFRIPFLGVQGDRRYLGPPGAKIERAVEGGPAGEAGLRGGDLIVEFGGAPVESFDELRRLIFAREVGEEVKVKVKRGEEVLELDVTLGEMRS